MKPRILFSGSEISRLVYRRLAEDPDLEDLFSNKAPINIEDKNQLPILLLGSGMEHDVSHTLSQLLAGRKEEDLIKVMFDQHDDLAENGKLSEMRAGEHLYFTLSERFVSEAHVYGVDCIREPYIDGAHVYPDLESSKHIKGKKIHLSVDLDVIDERYVDMMWRPGEFKFEDLLDNIKQLSKDNEIVALDICGVNPYNCWDSEYRYVLETKGETVADNVWSLRNKPNVMSCYEVLEPGAEKHTVTEALEKAVSHYKQIIRAVVDSKK
jgi:hypothetical protein